MIACLIACLMACLIACLLDGYLLCRESKRIEANRSESKRIEANRIESKRIEGKRLLERDGWGEMASEGWLPPMPPAPKAFVSCEKNDKN